MKPKTIELTGDEVRELFEAVLPDVEIEAFAQELGVVERQRKLDVVAFTRAAVISANTPSGGMQADALRSYSQSGAPRVARSSFYQRFDEAFEKLMGRLAERAMALALAEQVDLPGLLGGVRDWRIVDSSTVRVRDALKGELPGTGDYAALKVHQTLSVGCGAVVRYHVSPAREHDSLHLTIDESWAGYGLLCDLGYASISRLKACVQHGVKFVIRLKENWKPKVQAVARGEVTRTFFAGADFDALLQDGTLLLDGKAVDLDVHVGSGGDTLPLRLVGVPSPKGYCFFLTNLPPSIGPLQVGTLYRIRWEVELSIKLEKAVYRLDEGKGERVCSTRALLHASLIASILTALLVHRHSLKTRPKAKGAARTQAPLHQRLLGLALVGAARNIARAFLLEGDAAKAEWNHIAGVLCFSGKDPNWRSRPSVLDSLRGIGGDGRPPPPRRRPGKSAPER
jgi:putative transposase